jgi:hypothetical protein
MTTMHHRYQLLVLAGMGLLVPHTRGEEGIVEGLGIPVRAVMFGNSQGVLAPAPGGRGTMFYTAYYSSTGGELVGHDFRGRAALHKKLPSAGGYGLAVLNDAVFIGGVNPGNLYRYDPAADSLTTFEAAGFGVDYIWELAAGPDGVVYAAAGFPTSKLLALEPVSGQVRDLGEMVPGTQYLRALDVDRHGRVWCGIGTNAHLIVYDPSDGSREDVLPEKYRDSALVGSLRSVGDHVLANLLHDGLVMVFDTSSRQLVRTIPPPEGEKSWLIAGGSGETAYLRTTPSGDVYRYDVNDGTLTLLVPRLGDVKTVEDERWLHAVDDQDHVVYDLESRQVAIRKRLVEGGDGMAIHSLAAGPDGHIYGSTYINMRLFRCDAGDDRLTDLGRATRWPGQIDSLSAGSDGRLYMGAYINAVLSVFDPRLPWEPGRQKHSNPREIGSIGRGQYRTRANCLGPDGKLYVGSLPSYQSADRGALTICSPESGEMDVRLDFVKGGLVSALIADDKFVYGAGGGEFFVYDPATDSKHFREDRAVVSLAFGPGGKVLGSGGGKLFLYDRSANRISDEQSNPAGDFSHMASASDGAVYGVNAGHLCRIDPDGLVVEVLAREGGQFAAVDRRDRLYSARGPHLLRWTPPVEP